MKAKRLLIITTLLLIALGGCTWGGVDSVYNIKPQSSTIKVGKSLQLNPTLHHEFEEFSCDDRYISDENPQEQDPYKFSWSVEPETGATISNQGIFKASRPGKYYVSIKLVDEKPRPNFRFYRADVNVAEENSDKTENDSNSQTQLFEDKPEGEPVKIFEVGSLLAVQNGGTPPSFTMKKDHWITELWTYHWNGGKGTSPGTIALQSAEGKTYGPWKATLYNKVYWIAKPKINLPSGKYTVIDSDPSTFAQNSETGGRGMAWMHGIPLK